MLLDLSQTATIEASTSVASRVLKGLKTVGKTHKPGVERAGFVVLKSPDIPRRHLGFSLSRRQCSPYPPLGPPCQISWRYHMNTLHSNQKELL